MTVQILHGLNNYLIDFYRLYDTGNLPKVIMLSGNKGQGKFTLIHHLMAIIFDKLNYDLKNFTIKEKNKLIHNIKENYNTNIIYYSCGDKNVKIDEIRDLRLNIQKSSINGLNRYIILDDVECLNENCVNALLKTIEEPSKTNYFIMINNKSKNLLSTLKSRSIEIMIFLDKNKKLDVIKKLLANFELDENISLDNSTLTPGNYLTYNKFVLDEKININDKLIINIDKLLKLNKSKKNINYLNFAIYLVDQYFLLKSKREPYVNSYNDDRINIIKKLHNFNRLNLNYANLITEIENCIS